MRIPLESRVHIWCGEHRAYALPGNHGHTTIKSWAGVFPLAEALEATRHCGPEKQIEFEITWSRSDGSDNTHGCHPGNKCAKCMCDAYEKCSCPKRLDSYHDSIQDYIRECGKKRQRMLRDLIE